MCVNILLIVFLFIIGKTGNSLRTLAYLYTLAYLCNGILYSSKNEEAATLRNGIDGPGEHYAK